MSTSPFGAAGFGFPQFDPSDWERASRQWFAGMAPPSAAPQAAAMDPFAWLQPPRAAPAAAGFDPTALAAQWMGRIQQLAAQFGGTSAAPADIAQAWRGMLGENPFAGATGAAAFMPSAFFNPGADAGARGPFDTPAFGFTREHQERAQAGAATLVEFQKAAQKFQGIVAQTGQAAFARFESLLTQRSSDNKPVESARALFDLWIDAAEDAYADAALGDEFQQAFGDYVNAQMRVRAGMQKQVEASCAQVGIPGREEVDAAHRKIAQLERELSRLKRAFAASESATSSRREPRGAVTAVPAASPQAACTASQPAAEAPPRGKGVKAKSTTPPQPAAPPKRAKSAASKTSPSARTPSKGKR